MTTLFAVYDNTGRCISYCSARCYNAKPLDKLSPNTHDKCECVCRGLNHAQGERTALKNYEAGIGMRPEDLQAFAKARNLNWRTLTVIDRLRVEKRRAGKLAAARLKPPKPGPLFAYGRL